MEASGRRERLRLRRSLRRIGVLPRLLTPDSQRPGVRRLRRSLGAEKSFRDVPPTFGKLRRTERHIHIVGILEHDVVISVGVAIRWAAETSAGRRRLQWMSLQYPIANVDDMNVLLHDDVARKHAIVHPIA